MYGVLAQLGEYLPYKQRVIGSSPIGPIESGRIPEWPKGTDCKSAANCFGGSNPPPPIETVNGTHADVAQLAEQLICNQQVIGSSPIIGFLLSKFYIDAGWSSLEARRAHNPKVIGSNPIPATYAQIAQLVEQRTENPRVAGSIPALGILFYPGV